MKETPQDLTLISQTPPITNGALNAPKPSNYLSDLDDVDMTEAQKMELLETLFSIMKSYVALGYGLDPVNKLIAQFERAGGEARILLNCEHTKPDNPTTAKEANDE